MPREEKLSSRLDSLLDAIFDVPSNPLSLYWDIVEELRPEQLALAQKKIQKRLQTKGAIRPESAFLVASILHLTGFPAHRIMHFLSLYVNGSIGLSLFEFAVTTIFRGTPPLSASLVYDITQYTYLEKRLLARKSMEISARLKDSLNAELLLYLYLLSLRDDLSNENVQLIALIMKNCFPALEVRTRVGGVTLEEYGEIARAWKSAENRTLANDLAPWSNTDSRPVTAFDRDSASYFLDKYFSDAALSKVRVNVPLSSISERRRRESAPVEPAPAVIARRPRDEEPTLTVRTTKRPSQRSPARETAVRPADQPAPPIAPPDLDLASSRKIQSPNPPGARRAAAPRQPQKAPKARTPGPTGWWKRSGAALRDFGARLIPLAPLIVAAVLVGIVLVSVPLSLPARASPQSAQVTATPSIAPTPSALPPAAATSSDDSGVYVVREGDSLWRIFMSLKGSQAAAKGWASFLSSATSLNDLGNPDKIHPGKILTFTPSAK